MRSTILIGIDYHRERQVLLEMIYTKYRRNALNARQLLRSTVRRGVLKRPDHCELCNLHVPLYNKLRVKGYTPSERIEGHHYAGYDHPLEVWWVCHRCNMRVHEHDGSLNLVQARMKYGIQWIGDTRRYTSDVNSRISPLFRSPDELIADVRAVFGE